MTVWQDFCHRGKEEKRGNPKRATHAIYYRPCRKYTMDPPKSGKSRKRFKIHQEQKYVSVPHHARLPLITEARSKQPAIQNYTILSWSKSDTASFIELDLANVSGDFCFWNWMLPPIFKSWSIYPRILIGFNEWVGGGNNYVDQILSDFDPHPLRRNKNGYFTSYLPFATWPLPSPWWTFDWSPPPPRNYWMSSWSMVKTQSKTLKMDSLFIVLPPVQVILFEIDCAIFYTNELFSQFVSWTNWVNSGKFW